MSLIQKMIDDGKIKIYVSIKRNGETFSEWIARTVHESGMRVRGIEISEQSEKANIHEALDFGSPADLLQCDTMVNKNLSDTEMVCYPFYFWNKNERIK